MGLLLKHKTYCPIFSGLDLEEPVRRLIELATSTTGIQVLGQGLSIFRAFDALADFYCPTY